MADKTIHDLPSATIALTNEFEMQATGGGASGKVTAQDIVNLAGGISFPVALTATNSNLDGTITATITGTGTGTGGTAVISGSGSATVTTNTLNSAVAATYIISTSDGNDADINITTSAPSTGEGGLTLSAASDAGDAVAGINSQSQTGSATTTIVASGDAGSKLSSITLAADTSAAHIAINDGTSVGTNGQVFTSDGTNAKWQNASGGGISALTGDVAASGVGSVAATLATVNSNVGSYTNANITVNGKGLVTAAASGSAPGITGTEIAVTGAVTATIGRMHLCTGTSADYTVTLPAASGNTGNYISFRMGTASTLTKIVTLDGNASETIDGNATVAMTSFQTRTLYCDGSNWFTVADSLSATVTGSGASVLATSPTLVTPALGTPASGNLANCTAFTLTTIGSSGAATYSGGTLNVPQYSGGGAAGDMLSVLTAAEISITGTGITGTISRMHVCSGTSADYTVTLPAASGNTGKFIGFRMATGLTKLVTLDGNASETIDGALTRIMWAGEACILLCDGSNWFKVAGKTIPMIARMGLSADQTGVANTTQTLVNLNRADVDNTGAMCSTGSHTITLKRPGAYDIAGRAIYDGITINAQAVRLLTNIQLTNTSGTQIAAGELVVTANNNAGCYAGGSCADVYNGSAGDVLILSAYQSSGTTGSFYGAAGSGSCFMVVEERTTW